MAVDFANGCGQTDDEKEDNDEPCVNPEGHVFVHIRAAAGQGWRCGARTYCIHCGAEGGEE